eukprot:Lithocolla_globosa_v1_NODE_1058_length_2905_cov_16.696491.p5 type:complete len:110 gc:universal NODE_1058_length_2905_cov_16.696491:2379-2708(+)
MSSSRSASNENRPFPPTSFSSKVSTSSGMSIDSNHFPTCCSDHCRGRTSRYISPSSSHTISSSLSSTKLAGKNPTRPRQLPCHQSSPSSLITPVISSPLKKINSPSPSP